jgi:enoyl-CoA hydratase
MTDEAWTRQHVIFERMVRALIDCPVPIICAVNGAAYGGGCEIAGCCDFLYSSETARFALTEVTLGIMPGGGGTQTLPRAVGERRAKELILIGKPFAAAEAHGWGFVNEVFPLSELLPAALGGDEESFFAFRGLDRACRAPCSIAGVVTGLMAKSQAHRALNAI